MNYAEFAASARARYLKDRCVAWDIIDEAIAAYDGWMLDDDYDATSALKKIMSQMKKRRSFYSGAE